MDKNSIHTIETLDKVYTRIADWYKQYGNRSQLDWHPTILIPIGNINIKNLGDYPRWRIDPQAPKTIKTNATDSSMRFAGEVLHHVFENLVYTPSGELSATQKKNRLKAAIKEAKSLRATLRSIEESVRFNLSLCGENKMPLCDPLEYIEGIITAAEVEIGEVDGRPSKHILSVKPDHNPPKQTKYNRQIGTIYHNVIKYDKYLKDSINISSLSALIRAIYGDLKADWRDGADVKNDTFYKAVSNLWEKL